MVSEFFGRPGVGVGAQPGVSFQARGAPSDHANMLMAVTTTPAPSDFTHAREYRSVASMVHLQLLDVLDNQPPRLRSSERNRQRVEAVKRMLRLGKRYAPSQNGQLDATRSTSGTLTLAKELAELTPKKLAEFSEGFSMQVWVDRANAVLSAVEQSERPPDSQIEFARNELLPFLYAIVTLPDEEPIE